MPIRNRTFLLQDLEVPVSIGIHDFERNGPQRMLVTVEVKLSDTAPPGADRIEEVVDYDFIRDGIIDLAKRGHYELQETFAHAILDLCRKPGVGRVVVHTRKPDVYPDAAAVGYRVVWEGD